MNVIEKKLIKTQTLNNGLTCNLVSIRDYITTYRLEILQNEEVKSIYEIQPEVGNKEFFELKTLRGTSEFVEEVANLFLKELDNCYQWLNDDYNSEKDTIEFYKNSLDVWSLTRTNSAGFDAAVEALEFFYGQNSPQSEAYMCDSDMDDEDLTEEEKEKYVEDCDDYNYNLVTAAKEKADEMLKVLKEQYGL